MRGMSSSGSVPEGCHRGIQISDFQDRRDLNWLSSKRLRLLLLTLLLTLLLNLLLTFELAVFQTLAAVPLCTRWYDPHTCDACRFLDIGLAGITNMEVIPLVSDTVLAYTRSINSSRKSTHNVCYVRAYVCAHKQTANLVEDRGLYVPLGLGVHHKIKALLLQGQHLMRLQETSVRL